MQDRSDYLERYGSESNKPHVHKQMIDDIGRHYNRKNLDKMTYLGFPGPHEGEIPLLRDMGVQKFFGVEGNKKLFEAYQTHNPWGLDVVPLVKRMKRAIDDVAKQKVKIGLAILDFTGNLTTEMPTLEKIAGLDVLADDAFVSVTLCKRGEGTNEKAEVIRSRIENISAPDLSWNDFRENLQKSIANLKIDVHFTDHSAVSENLHVPTKGDIGRIIKILVVFTTGGWSLKDVRAYRYQGGPESGGQAMYVVNFRRVRKVGVKSARHAALLPRINDPARSEILPSEIAVLKMADKILRRRGCFLIDDIETHVAGTNHENTRNIVESSSATYLGEGWYTARIENSLLEQQLSLAIQFGNNPAFLEAYRHVSGIIDRTTSVAEKIGFIPTSPPDYIVEAIPSAIWDAETVNGRIIASSLPIPNADTRHSGVVHKIMRAHGENGCMSIDKFVQEAYEATKEASFVQAGIYNHPMLTYSRDGIISLIGSRPSTESVVRATQMKQNFEKYRIGVERTGDTVVYRFRDNLLSRCGHKMAIPASIWTKVQIAGNYSCTVDGKKISLKVYKDRLGYCDKMLAILGNMETGRIITLSLNIKNKKASVATESVATESVATEHPSDRAFHPSMLTKMLREIVTNSNGVTKKQVVERFKMENYHLIKSNVRWQNDEYLERISDKRLYVMRKNKEISSVKKDGMNVYFAEAA